MANAIAAYNPQLSPLDNWDQNIVPGNHEIELLALAGKPGAPSWIDVSKALCEGTRKDDLVEKFYNNPRGCAYTWFFLLPREKEEIWNHICEIKGEIAFITPVGDDHAASISDLKWVLAQSEREPQLVERYQGNYRTIAIIWKVLTVATQCKLWDEQLVPKGKEIKFLSHESLQTRQRKREIQQMLSQEEGKRRIALEAKYMKKRKKRDFLQAYLHPNAQKV
jgi:hypothetical protein